MESGYALDRLSASEIGRELAKGTLDPVSLTNEALRRAHATEESNIFISISGDRAIKEAHESTRRHVNGVPLSPLDGVPLVLKDLIDREDEITSAGSELYRTAKPAASDSAIASNLSSAGLISIGKVNLTEFAYSGLGLNPHYGTPINPFSGAKPKAPGGSSSGTAVAIASNIVPCGIGTDTGGSVRIPASFNGLVGYKTSGGRIDSSGIFSLSRMLDTIGPLGRSVEDCFMLDAALRLKAASAPVPRSIKRLPIYVTQSVVMDNIETDVARNFEASLLALEAAGAVIKHISIDEFSEVIQLTQQYGSLAAADAYAEHLQIIEDGRIDRVDPRVTARIMGGGTMISSDVIFLQRARQRLIQQMRNQYADGLIAMPTTVITAPEIEKLEADDTFYHEINLLVLRNTSLGNFLDLPGLALPNGVDRNAMPTSILLSAVSGMDDTLLQYGLALEQIMRDSSSGQL